jgi:hypothetical protein
MENISALYRLKEDPKTGKCFGKPDHYLGSTVGTYTFHASGQQCWFMSSDEYVAEAVKNVQTKLSEVNRSLKSKVSTPLAPSYRPELDVSALLSDEQANYFQNLIGILRWTVELGRIDIHVQVAQLSQYLAQPREGHLDAVFHIFAYLKKYSRSKLVLDSSCVQHLENRFQPVDWTDFYPNAAEPIPSNAPEPRGNLAQTNCFVDADHAGNLVTRRSHTGVLIYLCRAPIIWYSKRQNTVETSTFGSEFIAAKIATELIQAFRYKLRMMGIPIDGPTNVFCDNEAVVNNSTKPESQLKKKHVAICYHRVREACAAGMIRVAKEDGETNLADVLTKNLNGVRLRALIDLILF